MKGRRRSKRKLEPLFVSRIRALPESTKPGFLDWLLFWLACSTEREFWIQDPATGEWERL
jgi:hypothetical protein